MSLIKIAWVEDDTHLIEDNLPTLIKKISGVRTDTFRQTPHSSLDLELAKEFLTTTPYDLIILDDVILRQWVYPTDDLEAGELLLLDLKNQGPNVSTPVIMYTDDLNQRRVQDYRTMGANHWIPKISRTIWRDSLYSVPLNPIRNTKIHAYHSFLNKLRDVSDQDIEKLTKKLLVSTTI
jgi:hypothetical protein